MSNEPTAIGRRTFHESIVKAIHDEVERVVAEEAEEAARRVEKRVRERTAAIAATVLEHFAFEQVGTQLRISVDFKGLA